MNFDTILFEKIGGYAKITLNRPDKLNSFNTQMHAELREALDAVEGDSAIRCLLLTGAGRGFCAGQDLDDRAVKPGEGRPDLGASIENNYNPLIRRLTSMELPIICAVNGVAAGAGANIAIACDIVFASHRAKFIEPFCRLGLVPDSGGTWRLPRLVGLARAMGLALLGEAITAEQAETWGLIWKAVAPEALMEEAEALAAHLSVQPTKGLALTKRAIRAGLENSLDAHLDLERDLQREAGYTDDYQEGVRAFLEKRQPEFKGR